MWRLAAIKLPSAASAAAAIDAAMGGRLVGFSKASFLSVSAQSQTKPLAH